MSATATTAVVLSAAGSLVSASAAFITVVGRRPKVTVTARRGNYIGVRNAYFVEASDGDAIAVSVVNERDVAVEVETVWVQLRPRLGRRIKLWLQRHGIRRLGDAGVRALFPHNTIPDLPRTIAGRHCVVVRFGLAQVQAQVAEMSDPRGRLLVRMSDNRLIASRWLDLSGSAATANAAPIHEVSDKYHGPDHG